MKNGKVLRILAAVLLAVTLMSPAVFGVYAEGDEFTTESGFNCKVNGDGTVTITGYVDAKYTDGEDLEIPEVVYQGNLQYTVTQIGNYAFQNTKFLDGSLILPETLIYIGTNAFLGCSGLKGDLTIPDSVVSIGEGAFYDCTGFKGRLKLGSGLKEIGAGAFHLCGFTGSLEIPSSVSYIGNAAFFRCRGFTGDLSLTGNSMKIGGNDSVQDADCLDISVFYQCTGISGTLTIGEDVTYLDERAFYDLPNITRVVNNSDQEIDLSTVDTNARVTDVNDSPWTDKATGERITRIGKGIAVRDDYKEPIGSVEVSVVAPAAGTVITATEDPTYISGYDPDTQDPYPEASIPDDVPYRLMDRYLLYGYWFDDVLPDPFDGRKISFYVNDETHPEVEPGEKLLAEIWLEPTAGNCFTDETKVSAKGGTLIASELHDGIMAVYILVTVEDEPEPDPDPEPEPDPDHNPDPNPDPVPDTGDNGSLVLWSTLTALSVFALVLLTFFRKKNRVN